MATFEGQPAARPNRLGKAIVRMGLVTVGFYIGGVALSLNNDQFGELFCDNVPPVSYTHLDVYKRQVPVVAF